ncbi:hypothetical protein BGZ74_003796 [Mortierella antarctica]|nr:hypothetical protein BGZ74_003796 [Mortierella antarctica]
MTGAKSIAYLNKNWVLDAANRICREMKLMDADVCSGIVYSQGPVLIQAALQANLLSGDGKMIYFQALGIVSYLQPIRPLLTIAVMFII